MCLARGVSIKLYHNWHFNGAGRKIKTHFIRKDYSTHPCRQVLKVILYLWNGLVFVKVKGVERTLLVNCTAAERCIMCDKYGGIMDELGCLFPMPLNAFIFRRICIVFTRCQLKEWNRNDWIVEKIKLKARFPFRLMNDFVKIQTKCVKKSENKIFISSINQWTFPANKGQIKMLARCVSYQGSCDNINGILTRDYAKVRIKYQETRLLMKLN